MNILPWLLAIPAVILIRTLARILDTEITPQIPQPQIVPQWKPQPITILEWP